MSQHTASFQNHTLRPEPIVRHRRILVVDDDDIVRGLHEAVLSLVGYGTESASNAEEAMAMLADGDFDLLLTDCNMPALDGYDLIRALRASGNRIPVMMVSGTLTAGDDLPADLRSEVAVALPKPAGTSDLLAGIAHALCPTFVSPLGSNSADVCAAA